jgi:hypothetical protein
MTEELSGLIERVTFHNGESGFCVLRVKTRRHREEFRVEGTELPKTVLAQDANTKILNAVLNPDHVLWKGSVTFDCGQLYPLADQLGMIYGTVKDTGKDTPSQTGPCLLGDNTIDAVKRIRRVRGRDE